jgi:hypothetical protein
MSNLKTIVTVPLGTIKAFETDSLFKAMYAVKNPIDMYKLGSLKYKNKFIEGVEKNKVKLQQRYLRILKEVHIKILKRRHIQVISDDTDLKDINENFKIIYRKGNKWYAAVLQDDMKGGQTNKITVRNVEKKGSIKDVPFNDELEEAFVKHILKNHESDMDKIKESMNDRDIMMRWINDFLSKKELNVKHIATYESEMEANIKQLYVDTYGDKYKQKKDEDVFTSPHFINWYERNTMSGGKLRKLRKLRKLGKLRNRGNNDKTYGKVNHRVYNNSTSIRRDYIGVMKRYVKKVKEVMILYDKEIATEIYTEYLDDINKITQDIEDTLKTKKAQNPKKAKIIKKSLKNNNISKLVKKLDNKYMNNLQGKIDKSINLFSKASYPDDKKIKKIINQINEDLKLGAIEIVLKDNRMFNLKLKEFIQPITYLDFNIDEEIDFYDNNKNDNINIIFFKIEDQNKKAEDTDMEDTDMEEDTDMKDTDMKEGGSQPIVVPLLKYYNRDNDDGTVFGKSREEKEISFVQGLNAVIAICETIHDFADCDKFEKSRIVKDYDGNLEYVHITNNISNEYYYQLEAFKRLAISVNSSSESCSSRKQESSSSGASSSLGKEESPSTSGTWEKVFLSKFFYDLLPLQYYQNIFKLNIHSEYYKTFVKKYFEQSNYDGYFYDTSISRNDRTGYYSFTDLKKDVLTDIGVEPIDTIAKWWDPSTGGGYINNELKNFNDILNESVVQPLTDKVSFVKIEDETKIMTTNGNIDTPTGGFTITNCKKLILQPKNQPLLFYDLKRSGDHGQVMYLKYVNKTREKKVFLITGDYMCATKAMMENVPVLFKKYHKDKHKEENVDLYFYDPYRGNFTREYLITKNERFFNKIEPIINRIKDGEAVPGFAYNFKITGSKLEIEENMLSNSIEKNYEEMSNIINYFEYFVFKEETTPFFITELNSILDEIVSLKKDDTYYEKMLNEMYSDLQDKKNEMNANVNIERTTSRVKLNKFNENIRIFDVKIKEAKDTVSVLNVKEYNKYLLTLKKLKMLINNIKLRYDNVIKLNESLKEEIQNSKEEIITIDKKLYTELYEGVKIIDEVMISEKTIIIGEIFGTWDDLLKNTFSIQLELEEVPNPQEPPNTEKKRQMRRFKTFFKKIKDKIFGK